MKTYYKCTVTTRVEYGEECYECYFKSIYNARLFAYGTVNNCGIQILDDLKFNMKIKPYRFFIKHCFVKISPFYFREHINPEYSITDCKVGNSVYIYPREIEAIKTIQKNFRIYKYEQKSKKYTSKKKLNDIDE